MMSRWVDDEQVDGWEDGWTEECIDLLPLCACLLG